MTTELGTNVTGASPVACSALLGILVILYSIFFYAWFNALACFGAILKDHDDNLNKCKNSKNDGEPKNALREPSKLDCVLHEPVRLLRQCLGMLNKLGRLLQKPVGSLLRLLPANLVINRRLKMNGIRNTILNKNNATGTHRAELGKAVIRQLARSQISEGFTDVHDARKMPNACGQWRAAPDASNVNRARRAC
jgi:hypothetical protein